MSKLKAFLGNTSGTTSLEYALIAATIAIVIVAAVQSIGPKVNASYVKVSGNLS
jgi:pilus assembly protein Flp/PilA